MYGCAPTLSRSLVRTEWPWSAERNAIIRELNDRLRVHNTGGRLVVSYGVSSLPAEMRRAVLGAVATYNAFEPEGDRYGERDYGILDVGEHVILWKIEYYDANTLFDSPDPADARLTCRLLHVLLLEEF